MSELISSIFQALQSGLAGRPPYTVRNMENYETERSKHGQAESHNGGGLQHGLGEIDWRLEIS